MQRIQWDLISCAMGAKEMNTEQVWVLLPQVCPPPPPPPPKGQVIPPSLYTLYELITNLMEWTACPPPPLYHLNPWLQNIKTSICNSIHLHIFIQCPLNAHPITHHNLHLIPITLYISIQCPPHLIFHTLHINHCFLCGGLRLAGAILRALLLVPQPRAILHFLLIFSVIVVVFR